MITLPLASGTDRTVTVAPTVELVPMTRKSLILNFALLIVTVSARGVTQTSSVRLAAPTVTVTRKVSARFVIG